MKRGSRRNVNSARRGSANSSRCDKPPRGKCECRKQPGRGRAAVVAHRTVVVADLTAVAVADPMVVAHRTMAVGDRMVGVANTTAVVADPTAAAVITVAVVAATSTARVEGIAGTPLHVSTVS